MKQVLIVDDSPSQVLLMKQYLERHGFATISAASGEEAVRIARSHKPDLIIMDVVMPRMNGFQATRRINRDPETAAIPIVIVSSKEQETDRIWGIRQGARDYLVKPVAEASLVNSVRTLLGMKPDSSGEKASAT